MSEANIKLWMKFLTAAHEVGLTDMWQAQERITINDLEALLRRKHTTKPLLEATTAPARPEPEEK